MDAHRCPHCRGTGKVALNGVYRETMALVCRWYVRHGYLVASHAAEDFGCKVPALCNRLARLEALGYLTSEVHGRQRRYRPA